MEILAPRPGRPRKFRGPSRAVTVTLPEDVIARLQSLNGDLGSGIVSLTERRPDTHPPAIPTAEVSRYGNQAVIIVPMFNALKRLPGVELVPVGGGRALISLTKPHSIANLELALRDAADHLKASPERDALCDIAEILRKTRLSPSLSLQERTTIVLESKRQRRRA